MDYELDLLKKMQGLKQTGRYVQEYTKDLYWVLIRTNHVEADKDKFSYYLNVLRPRIQEELILLWMATINEAY